MTTISINKKDYTIKTNWNDVDYTEYCEIFRIKDNKENGLLQRVAKYSGIDFDILIKLSAEQVSIIIDLVKFMDTPEFVYDFAERFEEPGLKVANETYGKLEAAKTALKANENPLFAGAEIVELYLKEDIRKQPITQCINKIAFFLSSLNYSLNGLKGCLNTSPPSWNMQQVLTCLKNSVPGQQ